MGWWCGGHASCWDRAGGTCAGKREPLTATRAFLGPHLTLHHWNIKVKVTVHRTDTGAFLGPHLTLHHWNIKVKVTVHRTDTRAFLGPQLTLHHWNIKVKVTIQRNNTGTFLGPPSLKHKGQGSCTQNWHWSLPQPSSHSLLKNKGQGCYMYT